MATTSPVAVTALYAALLAALYVLLAVRVIRLRRRFAVGVGDGGEALLARAIRVHGNFAEYVPFALLLIALLELSSLAPLLLHGLGALLVAGRVLHAVGVARPREDLRLRVAGMSCTFTVLGVAATALLAVAAGIA